MPPPEPSGSRIRSIAEVTSRTQRLVRRELWIWPLAAAALLVFVGIWIRAKMEGAVESQVAANLRTILEANTEALRAWAGNMKSRAELVADDARLRELVTSVLKRVDEKGSSTSALLGAPEVSALRSHLKFAEQGRGFNGYVVLDTNLQVIAAEREQFIGLKSPPVYADRLRACYEGNAIVTAPFATMPALPDANGNVQAGLPLMFAAAPIQSEDRHVIAVLALRIAPEKDFTRILATARSGASGETYAFNRQGLILSESRFGEQIEKFGLLPDSAKSQSILALELRDPLVDLRQGRLSPKRRTELPWIRPVSEALEGRTGVNPGGYRDYRGVLVVGAWTWLPEFDMGVTTQVDAAEALAPLRVMRSGFWFLFGLLTAGSVAVFVLMRVAQRYQERAHRAAVKAEQLGQYTLDQEIGSGGFGTVFRAHHALMRRPVAVKVLSPVADTRSIARFEREVQMTCRLSHPNTIALYDYGRTRDGLFYYAMEYLDGLSLDRLVEQHGPQPEGRVIHILRQVCGSLAEAHGQGLVHRDIKPQNIFLSHRGGIPDFVKVLDFGLVKVRNLEGQLELTGANATLGTPLYISPEAAQHPDKVNAQSDLYSLASVGYVLLTGQTVFCGTTLAEVLMQQIRALPEPPSARLKRSVSPDLEGVIMQCLAKKPSARPADANALDEALARCSANGSWTRQMADEWWAKVKPAEAAEPVPNA